ncbi:MAG: hypothetical protein HHJ10_03720 [Cellulomonas sp.]|uniref:hypothetical protein n=1 Tax=Cellulomonas sp. TaxID=40001 RepID=UPI00181A2F60|nr:hypothetical protein [Cellulomonas sp.]NMM30163.1 hypothetical protein [Cellulomonas sp.]
MPPSIGAAQSLLEVAERHLASALVLADSDVVLAYDALHGANRKALTAILVAQGLRPTRAGGHIAVYEAVHAQLEPPLGRDLAAYNRVRRTRNAGDYRDEHEAVDNDVIADHPGCQKIVDIAKRVIGQMPPF